MKRRVFIYLFVGALGSIILVLGTIFMILHYKSTAYYQLPLTLDDLPEESRLIEHHHDVITTDHQGGVEMRHYGTPDAEEKGGPIYGVLGYRIVSIEYTIPAKMTGKQLVGKEFPGYDLLVQKNIPYDHFHMGITESHQILEQMATSSPQDSHSFLIHFMLISHEEEVTYGLMCG